MHLSHFCAISNLEEEFYLEMYDRAKKRGKIICANLGRHSFEYALISSKDGYGRDSIGTDKEPYLFFGSHVTKRIKKEEKAIGTCCAGYAFVFEKNIPCKDFSNYVGLHEIIESRQHGFKATPPGEIKNPHHGEACRIELEEVLKRDETFIDSYASWLIEREAETPGYFLRAVPDFVSFLPDEDTSPAEKLRLFKRLLDLGHHLRY